MPAGDPNIRGTYFKQPDEVVPLGRWEVDFSPDMIRGESIVAATMTVSCPTDTDAQAIIDGEPACVGTVVGAGFTGGLDRSIYLVHISATSNIGGEYSADFVVRVSTVSAPVL